jgi:hypothetical protein
VKREEVVAGAEYATDLGVHVRVEPEVDPESGEVIDTPSSGWKVVDGDWVPDHTKGKRLLKGGGTRDYLSNTSIRATEVDTGRKITIEPRRLTMTWDDHVVALAQSNEEREQMEYSAQALVVRAGKAGVKAHPDLRRRELRMSFTDADTLLRKAKI